MQTHPHSPRDGGNETAETPLAYTRRDAAKAIGISVQTLDRLVAAGAIRPCRAFRRPLFAREELRRFLLATTKTTP
jgi:hypothetical protein